MSAKLFFSSLRQQTNHKLRIDFLNMTFSLLCSLLFFSSHLKNHEKFVVFQVFRYFVCSYSSSLFEVSSSSTSSSTSSSSSSSTSSEKNKTIQIIKRWSEAELHLFFKQYQAVRLNDFRQFSTIFSIYRLGLVGTLVTHANKKGFGLASLSGVCRGFMPPQLKTKTERNQREFDPILISPNQATQQSVDYRLEK